MEIGHDVAALDVFGDEAELAEGNLVILEVSQRDLEHSAFQTLRGDFWNSQDVLITFLS